MDTKKKICFFFLLIILSICIYSRKKETVPKTFIRLWDLIYPANITTHKLLRTYVHLPFICRKVVKIDPALLRLCRETTIITVFGTSIHLVIEEPFR